MNKSGTPGAVTCDSSSCHADVKPAANQCPKTVDCGTFASCMLLRRCAFTSSFSCTIITRDHHKVSTINQHMWTGSFSFSAICMCPTASFSCTISTHTHHKVATIKQHMWTGSFSFVAICICPSSLFVRALVRVSLCIICVNVCVCVISVHTCQYAKVCMCVFNTTTMDNLPIRYKC